MAGRPPAPSAWDAIDARINRLLTELDSLNQQILDYNLRLSELAERLQRLVWSEPPSNFSEMEMSSSREGAIAEEQAVDTYYADVQRKVLSNVEVSRRLKEMTTVSHAVGCSSEQEEWMCAVCREGWEVESSGGGGDEVKLLACSHMYHTICIAAWLAYKNLCPLCRSSVY
ncbi:probable E3 ubiquitin-protein ligase RHG1A [Nymphaea colorata]|uniref:probable E3 ubiquitin-protein ligase RHG1A n=1 Tax=Nymphaea colorata TaxID=210225 RepID=UPI00129E0AD8|nr:probable E3 ubiquitin-protein ligase RHG1A [Nymphaea colorata]